MSYYLIEFDEFESYFKEVTTEEMENELENASDSERLYVANSMEEAEAKRKDDNISIVKVFIKGEILQVEKAEVVMKWRIK